MPRKDSFCWAEWCSCPGHQRTCHLVQTPNGSVSCSLSRVACCPIVLLIWRLGAGSGPHPCSPGLLQETNAFCTHSLKIRDCFPASSCCSGTASAGCSWCSCGVHLRSQSQNQCSLSLSCYLMQILRNPRIEYSSLVWFHLSYDFFGSRNLESFGMGLWRLQNC